MLWLGRHRVVVLIGIGLIVALPAMIKSLRDTTACFAEIGAADWRERLMVFAHVRPCPSGEP